MFSKRFFIGVLLLSTIQSNANIPCPIELINSAYELHNEFTTFLEKGLIAPNALIPQASPNREYRKSRRWVEVLRAWNEATAAERARISVELEKEILIQVLSENEFPQTSLRNLETLREQAAKAEEIIRTQLIKASQEVDAAEKTLHETPNTFFPRWMIYLISPFSSKLLKNWDKKKATYNQAKENVLITKTDLQVKLLEQTQLTEAFTAIAGLREALERVRGFLQMGKDHPVFTDRFDEAISENQNAVLGLIYLFYVVSTKTSDQLTKALKVFNQTEDFHELLNQGTGSLSDYFSQTFKVSRTSQEYYSDLSVIINQIGIPFTDLEKIRNKWLTKWFPSEEVKKLIATIKSNLPHGQLTLLKNRMQKTNEKIQEEIDETKGKKLGFSKILTLQKLKREQRQINNFLKITTELLALTISKPMRTSLESSFRGEESGGVEINEWLICHSLWMILNPNSNSFPSDNFDPSELPSERKP